MICKQPIISAKGYGNCQIPNGQSLSPQNDPLKYMGCRSVDDLRKGSDTLQANIAAMEHW